MEKIFEKIRGLDKKIQIMLCVLITIIIILIIISIRISHAPSENQSKPNGTELESQHGIEDGGNIEEFGTEILETEYETEILETEKSDIEISDEMVSDDEILDEETKKEDHVQEESGNGKLPSGENNQEGEEMLETGVATMPYVETLGNDLTVQTVEIAAGQIVYYDIYRVGGMYLTINDVDAYVITSSGKKYEAKNGKVSFKVENAMANEYVSFQIGNKGNEDKSFTIKFSNVTGSRQNPTVLNELSGTTDLPYGSDVGYYYKYIASQSGNIRFYIDSATNEAEINVTNNRNTMNRTFSADALTDDQGKKYIELVDVKEGDVLMINIVAMPDASWSYPETTVIWHGEYYVTQ